MSFGTTVLKLQWPQIAEIAQRRNLRQAQRTYLKRIDATSQTIASQLYSKERTPRNHYPNGEGIVDERFQLNIPSG